MTSRNEKSELHLMIVVAIAAVGMLFALCSKGCEFDGGRPADAHPIQ